MGLSLAVPGHDRWHPEIPGVAEVITGGSVRLECEGRGFDGEPVLCGPLVVVGAEPGDVIVVDVLAVGRADGIYSPGGHPGVIGCAPAEGRPGDGGGLLGRVTPMDSEYARIAGEAVTSLARGREIGGCSIARLTAGSRILLPVHVRGVKLSVGDLHFGTCGEAVPGWIDLRVNLTRQGVERFRVTGPMLMPDPG
ncbi:acetamidase/formamidase family protein [Actinomadura rudentiformis]|uniref:Formamidase n=1 Tax=Actinomadura rudentiformis TaxID=359158 RepID=A0A6H9YFD5_9ACTN|nr:acetamidase/formamidase family protein [Actinomadura rudentiformis]KAB2342474.1 formamidase [Actinomadura rudentiformis]